MVWLKPGATLTLPPLEVSVLSRAEGLKLLSLLDVFLPDYHSLFHWKVPLPVGNNVAAGRPSLSPMNPIVPPSSPPLLHVCRPLRLASRVRTRGIQINSVCAQDVFLRLVPVRRVKYLSPDTSS